MTAQTKQLVLVGLAAVILLAAFARSWFFADLVSIGLWGIELCDRGCRGIRWDNVHGAQDDLYLAGYLAFGAALAGAAAVIAHVAGMKSAARIGRITLAIALAGMAYFILRALAFDGLRGVSLDWALFAGPVATFAAYRLLPRG
jgi:hypothetical protein